MTGEIRLDAAAMTAVAGDLDDTGSALTSQQSAIEVRPDAAASSQEVADAFAGFSAAVQGLAASVGDAADQVRASVTAYQQSDQRSSGGFGGPR